MGTVLLESLRSWWPEACLSIGALLAIVLGAEKAPRTVMAATWGALTAAGIALWTAPALPATGLFFGLIVTDPLSLAFRWLILGTLVVTTLLLDGSREIPAPARGACCGLILLLGVGLMLMAEAAHLLMAYLAMELVSLSSYLLVGFLYDARSAEASLKYLLFGALASAIMLFGMSLLYGMTGALAFADLRAATSGALTPGLIMAAVLLLAGLAFKVSMVPFHLWTPDVYEGAPIAVTALLSVGPKAAGLALLLRLLGSLPSVWPALMPLLLALTIVTMTLGNLAALGQTNVKRLLAYSTIGQVGYLLIGLVAGTRLGLAGLILYLAAYLFMNLGAFACVAAVVDASDGRESLDVFRGLSARAPGLALAFTALLLSLAGIPPLFGFFGKFLLFGAAIERHLGWLAVAAILNSAVALYYYVNLIRLMYLQAPQQPQPVPLAPALSLALAACTAATVLLGLFPGPALSAVARCLGGVL